MPIQPASTTLSRNLLLLMALLSGLIVANNYYNQPLLALIAVDFNVKEAAVSKISVLTQLGYACGLLFIIPLGDKLMRKRMILVDLLFVVFALLLMAYASEIWVLFLASFLIGVSSVIPQLFIPIVAELSSNDKKAANIGIVMSGLLLGILLSRFIGGIVGEHLGWRAMFKLATLSMLLAWVLVYKFLPDLKPNFVGSYKSLMKSLWHFAKTEPTLQLAAFRGAMGFAAMSALFTTLVFHLEEAPFFAGPSIAGSFGLVGAVGALCAVLVGRLNKRFTGAQLLTLSLTILLSSWVFTYFGGNTYTGLIIGVILLDLGLQSSHILNQADYFAIPTTATSRLNTVYMVSYFIGGSLGTFLAALAWEYAGWPMVCLLGSSFSLLALLAHLVLGKPKQIT